MYARPLIFESDRSNFTIVSADETVSFRLSTVDCQHLASLLLTSLFPPSGSSLPPSSRIPSPRRTPHPHAAPRPSPDHSSAPAQFAPPSPWSRPRRSLARRAANIRFPRRRRYESKPMTPRSPYSPARSATANPRSHPIHPSSIPSRDTVKPPTHNPDDRAQSQSGPSIPPLPLNHSVPIQTCRAPHSPASKSAMAIPETSRASAPA